MLTDKELAEIAERVEVGLGQHVEQTLPIPKMHNRGTTAVWMPRTGCEF